MNFAVSGVVPAMALPLADQGRTIEFAVLRQLCDFLIERGVGGLFVLGTTGEGPLLSAEERRHVAERAVQCVHGRVPVIVNCGDITTQGTIELVAQVRSAGADAASVVFPYYYHLGEEHVMAHFAAVARSAPGFPIFLYYYRRALQPEQTRELRQAHPNLVGMKDGVGDYKSLLGHAVTMDEGFCILAGSEVMAYGALTLGVDGLISGIATAFPEPFVRLCRLVDQGAYEAAREEQALIYKLAQAIYGHNPWGRIKKSLQLRGLDVGPPRLPVAECNAKETEELRQVLHELGLL